MQRKTELLHFFGMFDSTDQIPDPPEVAYTRDDDYVVFSSDDWIDPRISHIATNVRQVLPTVRKPHYEIAVPKQRWDNELTLWNARKRELEGVLEQERWVVEECEAAMGSTALSKMEIFRQIADIVMAYTDQKDVTSKYLMRAFHQL